MYISALSRNKKSRKSLLFKRKVVETFRAEIATADQIQQTLHISQTELRRLNRWYFKHRLKPYLFLESFIPTMTLLRCTGLLLMKNLFAAGLSKGIELQVLILFVLPNPYVPKNHRKLQFKLYFRKIL